MDRINILIIEDEEPAVKRLWKLVKEILPNAQATQKVLVPAIRDELKKLYGGPTAGFEAFLSEHFFDLHYQATAAAMPVNLGLGNMWRLAVDHPVSQVLPCVHRAPREKAGQPRLLMIC